jgi:hypothetical protein
LLKSPALRRLDIDDVFLTKREIKELLALVQERRILKSVVFFSWMNCFDLNHLPPGIADESEFELLLNTIESTNPQMIFHRLCL